MVTGLEYSLDTVSIQCLQSILDYNPCQMVPGTIDFLTVSNNERLAPATGEGRHTTLSVQVDLQGAAPHYSKGDTAGFWKPTSKTRARDSIWQI